MRRLFFCQRFALLLLVLIGLGTQPGAAQVTRRYTDRVISSVNTLNPGDATGYNPSTQATLAPPAVVGAAALRLGFASTVPVGSKAGLMVDSGGLLTLAALAGLAINTYQSPSDVPQQSFQLSQLLTLQVLNRGAAAAEFTVTKPFDHIELVAGGVLNAYTLGLRYVYADVAAPLPVELVAFTGKATAAGVQLSWQTASEINNSYFAVERSADGPATAFAELGRVAGAGSSGQSHSYQYLDAAPGATGYYRLRQVDTDGQVHYSPVVVVARAAPAVGLAAYPNPATSTLLVTGLGEAQLGIFNPQGQLLRQVRLAPGQPLDISGLPTGVYYLRDAATGQSTRFVKTGGR